MPWRELLRVSDKQLRTGPWRSVEEYVLDAVKYAQAALNWRDLSMYREASTMCTVVKVFEPDRPFGIAEESGNAGDVIRVKFGMPMAEPSSNMEWLDRRVEEMRVRL